MEIEYQYRQPRIDRQPSRAVLARFAGSVLGLGAGCAAILRWILHEATIAHWTLGIALVLAAVALLPGVGRVLYVAWMSLGAIMGRLTSPLVLAVIYFGVITPCALLLKLLRRDALQLRARRDLASYWQPYPEQKDRRRYLKPF